MEERLKKLEKRLDEVAEALATFELFWAYEKLKIDNPNIDLPDMTDTYIGYKEGRVDGDEFADELQKAVAKTIMQGILTSLEKG